MADTWKPGECTAGWQAAIDWLYAEGARCRQLAVVAVQKDGGCPQCNNELADSLFECAEQLSGAGRELGIIK